MNDLTNLQTFIAVATAGSFAKAAARLNLSPAMVGRRLQALEADYGVKLIERTTRTQRLTEIGVRFLERASRVIDELERLNDLAGPQNHEISGHLRISGPTTLGVKRLASSIARFANQHPAVSLDLNLSDRNVDLIAEGYDLAIRVAHLRPSSLIARRIGTYRFVCCASPGYLDRAGVPSHPEQLEQHRCLLSLNLVPRDQWHFEGQDGRVLSAKINSNIGIDNGEAMRVAAVEGAGIIYAPLILVEEDIAAGRLTEVLAEWHKYSLPIHAVHPSRQFVPRRVKAVIDWIAGDLR
ncbi:LysR family transcriptional regulator [Rhizobium aegyptiacum]|uniref:LysR family transcriptional regulator n=1 Tax=Rhizobium aegyptiacum TaxID=1764550 RepID=UPI0007E5B437|nr:LysR family transcriptional regulator [Rhizobium aegyptiacum]